MVLSRESFAVWLRNFRYFQKSWFVSFFWIILEPSFYLAAIGYGLGRFVDSVDGLSYIDFYYPALLATTAMFVPFFEATYGSFTKMVHQKTFTTIVLTPVSASEVVSGEILWAASKGFFGVLGVTVIAQFAGLNHGWGLLPSLAVLALTCWMFAGLGMLATSLARNYDSFIYATSGLVIPMSLFSGTYFSLDDFPDWIHRLAYVLPLTHSVTLVRSMMTGRWDYWLVLHLVVVLAVAHGITKLAIHRIREKMQA